MTFEELRLMMAIKMYDDAGDKRLRDLSYHLDQIDRASQVQSIYARWFETTVFPWEYHEVNRLILNYRKMPSEDKVKMAVALTHGHKCFWLGRGKGECDLNAECGHLVPRSKGGELSVSNCVIECRAHNNQRRAMTIEEYLQSDLITG